MCGKCSTQSVQIWGFQFFLAKKNFVKKYIFGGTEKKKVQKFFQKNLKVGGVPGAEKCIFEEISARAFQQKKIEKKIENPTDIQPLLGHIGAKLGFVSPPFFTAI